jgi:hypothetical protein
MKNFFLLAYRRPDNTVRYASIIYPGSPKNTNLNIAVDHFAALAKKEGAALTSGKEVSADNNRQKETTTSKQQKTPTTAPGQGLKSSEIRGIVINAESGIGVGGMEVFTGIPQWRRMISTSLHRKLPNPINGVPGNWKVKRLL